jgi:hypothetical protein
MAAKRKHSPRNEPIPQSARVAHDVTDISDANGLLSYALAGQLEQLLRHRTDLSLAGIAEAARLSSNRRNSAATLSRALRNGPTGAQLQKLDEIIGVLASDLDGTGGGLSSLALRLSAERRGEIKETLMPHVPPSWTGRILKDHPSGELEVLIQASALLSAFMAADKVDAGRSVERIRDHYGKEMELLARRLILISAAPPTARNYDAQMMLGSLASYAFELMKDQLELQLRYSPLAFRVWRAITKLVRLRGDGEHAELRAWVRQLIRNSGELRQYSIYPGRSLDLELAITVPAAWSPPGGDDDWVGDALSARAWDPEATIRERGTAAMGLWQRALAESEGGTVQKTEEDLRNLITEFRKEESRPDAAAGLRWVAATLECVIDKQEAVCNDWPECNESWFRHVQQAADELDNYGIPDHLRTGTKNLFRHMILQNAGVLRRQALETLVTSGWGQPVAQALSSLLKNEKDEAWLRIRAEFALGFLERPNQWVEADLTTACLDAYNNLKLDQLKDDEKPPRARVTEMHASLFAVGDCFGVAGAEERAKSARDRLRTILTELAGAEGHRALVLARPARAAAYLLTVTAQARDGDKKDLSEVLLERLRGHPDQVTARLSNWALSFRFAPDGAVRPLLDAAESAERDDTPWY